MASLRLGDVVLLNLLELVCSVDGFIVKDSIKFKSKIKTRIKKLLAYMDFATRLRIAQEDNKKNKKKPK
jgi:hypothetical protein